MAGLCLICTTPFQKATGSASIPLPSRDILDLISNLFQIPPTNLSSGSESLQDTLELCGFCQVVLQEASHLMEDIVRFQSRLESIGEAVRQKILITNEDSNPPSRKTRSETSWRGHKGLSTVRKSLIECWGPSVGQVPLDPLNTDPAPPTNVPEVEIPEVVPNQDSRIEKIVTGVSQIIEGTAPSISSLKLETEEIPVVATSPVECQEVVNFNDAVPGCSWQVSQSSTSTPAVDPLKQEVVWELVASGQPGTEMVDESMIDESGEDSMLMQGTFDNPGMSESFQANSGVRTRNKRGRGAYKKIARYIARCPICGKVFRDNHVLMRHMVRHDPNPQKVTCLICGRSYKCQEYLRRHNCKKPESPEDHSSVPNKRRKTKKNGQEDQ